MGATNEISFKEALQILGIEEYGQRILYSNSHGEIFHIYQYGCLAESIGSTTWFPLFFKGMVNLAEKEWTRPESVFQHVTKILHIAINAKQK
jgi:hypothetical protein